jgi:hypothetical protein
MMEDRFLKRLRTKARKGLRGWPIATIAFYGPTLSQATKVAVGIVPSETAEVVELGDWKVDYGDIRADPGIAREILEFIEKYLASGMIRGIGPVYAKKLLRAFGDKVFDVIEAEPDRLREVDGIVGGLERARGSFRALARSVSPIPARPFLLLPAGTP